MRPGHGTLLDEQSGRLSSVCPCIDSPRVAAIPTAGMAAFDIGTFVIASISPVPGVSYPDAGSTQRATLVLLSLVGYDGI